MNYYDSNKKNFLTSVAIIIPCYKASKFINLVLKDCQKYLSMIEEKIEFKIVIINDACPEQSLKNVSENDFIKIIHNKKNIGVGASTLKGIKYALKNKYDFMIKLDADGQHPPKLLVELIEYMIRLPKYQLFLTKGSRYKVRIKKNKIPLLRKVGTLFMDPIARSALGYRNLSDVTNGFFGMDSKTASFLLNPNYGTKIENRYLFESSILAKCSELGININEFCMYPNYGKDWTSSMNAPSMIVPVFFFWIKEILKRIYRKYFLKINLGTLLIIIALSNFVVCQILLFNRIIPEVKKEILVSAGTSTAFTSSFILATLTISLFLFYDYASGIKVNTIFFKEINNFE